MDEQPASWEAFARLVDRLPNSDHKSLERLKKFRKADSVEDRYFAEIKAIDWKAFEDVMHLYDWTRDQLEQCSTTEKIQYLQLHFSEAQFPNSNDLALPGPSWIMKHGFATYKGKKFKIVPRLGKLLQELVEAGGESVSIEELLKILDIDLTTLYGYIKDLRKLLRKGLGLQMSESTPNFPIISENKAYRLELL